MNDRISPYVCKVSGATFKEPCTVRTCFAHVDNLNAAGTKAKAHTNCVYIDFNLAGFSENFDYAVEEQGFVGYRDLTYMSDFLKIPPTHLRDLYTRNVDMFRRAVAILWAVKSNHVSNYCKNCGHPLKDQKQFKCTSTTLCFERKTAVYDILAPILDGFEDDDLVKAYNAIWRSLKEKFVIDINLTQDELAILNEL